MDHQHCVSFRLFLPKGQHEFVLDNPKLVNSDLNYKLQFVSLIPDYFNESASAHDLDTSDELQAQKESLYCSLSIHTTVDYISKLDPTTSIVFNVTTSLERVCIQLHRLGMVHYSASTILPPFVIDYFILDASVPLSDESEDEDDAFHDIDASVLIIDDVKMFTEPYNSAIHDVGIPPECKNMPVTVDNVVMRPNPRVLPTNALYDTKRLRMRITLGPNMHLGFSNMTMLNVLGFSDRWIHYFCRKTNNQFWLLNDTDLQCKTYIADSKPETEFPQLKSTKVYLRSGMFQQDRLYTYRTPNIYLSVTNENARKIKTFVPILQGYFKEIFEKFKLKFNVTFDTTTSRYSLNFPDPRYFIVKIAMSPELLSLMGYSNILNDTLTYALSKTNNAIDLPSKNILQNQQLSQTLVYDTGMVSIVLADAHSHRSIISRDFIVNALTCHYDGTMRSHLYNAIIPFPQFDRYIKFQLLQYNELSQPIPLNWPRGCFIQGMMTGHL